MQTLIISFEGSPVAWFGPVRPQRGRYALLEGQSITALDAVQEIAARGGKFTGCDITGFEIVTDCRTDADAEREYREALAAEIAAGA